MTAKVGIIAGTGLSDSTLLKHKRVVSISTPYGDTSDEISEGDISEVPVAILSRHGKGHKIGASQVNYKANIWALKSLNCTHIIAITACGSLQKHIKPGDFVVLDQFYDQTRRRETSFYDNGNSEFSGVCHIPMAEPFCEETRKLVSNAIKQIKNDVHVNGTIVTIEGPRFSTKFESKVFHNLGASVINMTTVPEVTLAKELGMCYCSIATVTDYDSWNDDHGSVNVAGVIEVMKKNVEVVKQVLPLIMSGIKEFDWSSVLENNKKVISMSKL